MGGHALIIGGSLGGMFAAHLLSQIGWRVDVFERSAEDLVGRGAGIGTHAALGEGMRRIGIGVETALTLITGAGSTAGVVGAVDTTFRERWNDPAPLDSHSPIAW